MDLVAGRNSTNSLLLNIRQILVYKYLHFVFARLIPC